MDDRNPVTEPILKDLLRIMSKEQASDLILKSGGCPAMRVNGVIRFLGDTPLGHDGLRGYLGDVLGDRELEEFHRLGSTDTALSIPDIGRFRCNAFHQCGDVGFVFRRIKSDIPTFRDLHLPVEPLKKLAELKRGLVLREIGQAANERSRFW